MNKTLRICTWNANGVRNKLGELIHFLSREKIDIMLITETKLKESESLKLRNYTTLQKCRHNAAGGVAILVKQNIPYQSIALNQRISIEYIGIKLLNNVSIVVVYNNPRNNFKSKDLKYLLDVSNKVLLIGDLNARHYTWNCHVNNANGTTLYKYSHENDCTIMYPNEATHYPTNSMTPTTIDIAVNKNVHDISQLVVKNDLNSDHRPVLLQIGDNTIEVSEKRIYNYRDTDWKVFREELDKAIEINNRIFTKPELEAAVENLTSRINSTMGKIIKKDKIRAIKDSLPDDIVQLIKERNRIRRIWQRTRLPHLKLEYTKQTHTIKNRITEYRNKKWESKLNSLNPKDKSLWRMTKALKKRYQQIPTLSDNFSSAITDQHKAEMIATQFEKAHTIDLLNNTYEQQQIIETVQNYFWENESKSEEWKNHITSPKELATIIKYLPPLKAPGKDNIQNIILKNFGKKAIVQFTYIINAIFRLSHFPQNWKTAYVIPIQKPGKPADKPDSYRPISLLPTMAKVAEKVILYRIRKHEGQHKLTIDQQFGFREKHNTVQQVIRITNDIVTNFNKGNVTTMLLLDIEKAFDRVWIQGLIYKMIKYEYPCTIIKLVYSYLKQRNFKVVINNIKSTKKEIPAGVPQGSILGPVLFNIYLNDIPTFSKTNLALYADDTAIYAHSFSAIVAAKQLQIHVGMLEKYYKKWKILINTSKTEAIIFAKKVTCNRIIQPIRIYNAPIQVKQSVKYLGVTLDSRLTYRAHIKTIIMKGYATLKNLYSLMVRNSRLSVHNKKLIFKMIIRPILLYASPIWRSTAKSNMLPLQRYQNKCLRLILNKGRYVKISDLHEEADIEYLNDYITESAKRFYETQLKANTLTKHIIDNYKYRIQNSMDKHKFSFGDLVLGMN